jgi:hypothetical protein
MRLPDDMPTSGIAAHAVVCVILGLEVRMPDISNEHLRCRYI